MSCKISIETSTIGKYTIHFEEILDFVLINSILLLLYNY